MTIYKCEICDYSTETKQNYETHCMSNRHNKKISVIAENKYEKKQSQRVVCDGCGKTFARQSVLVDHKNKQRCKKTINQVSEEKRKCKICGKIYKQQAGLSRHKRSCFKNNDEIDDEEVDDEEVNDDEVDDEVDEEIENEIVDREKNSKEKTTLKKNLNVKNVIKHLHIKMV